MYHGGISNRRSASATMFEFELVTGCMVCFRSRMVYVTLSGMVWQGIVNLFASESSTERGESSPLPTGNLRTNAGNTI